MAKYKLSIESEKDLERIYVYGFYKFGMQQADKYYNMLFDCFERIAANPYMFPNAHYIKSGYRSCVCGVDTIYFKIDTAEMVEIITIIGRQNFK